MYPSDAFKKRNLTKVNFDYEELVGRDLSDTNMRGVNLSNRDIHNSDLSCSYLSESDLS